MTEREKIEREIILDILAESSKWRISEEDQTDDCIRLEVMDRARRLLLGTETVDANGYAQSHPEVEVSPVLTEDDYKALEAAKLNEHLASPEKVEKAWQKQWKWKLDKVRVRIDGKTVWKPKDQCTREPRDNSHGGPTWQWVWHDPNEKKSQEEEMWENHEAGND